MTTELLHASVDRVVYCHLALTYMIMAGAKFQFFTTKPNSVCYHDFYKIYLDKQQAKKNIVGVHKQTNE